MTPANPVGVPDPRDRPTLDLWPETGRYLGLSKCSTYDAAHRGEIPTIRIGRRLLVPTAALRRLLELDDPKSAA
ncbi:MAG: helix-turn-helix domain-containing protein [Actinomycetota bacterium]|nr:helix-turn-helix domain-containing protein [Actinomycetota bacterium]